MELTDGHCGVKDFLPFRNLGVPSPLRHRCTQSMEQLEVQAALVAAVEHLQEEVVHPAVLLVDPDQIQVTVQAPALPAEIQEHQEAPRAGHLAVVPLPLVVVVLVVEEEILHQTHLMMRVAAMAVEAKALLLVVADVLLHRRRRRKRK